MENSIRRNDLFSKAVYHGFVLKRSFWYGKLNGKNIAFCEHTDPDGYIKVYIQTETDEWMPFNMKKDKLKEIYPEFTA